MESNPTHNCYYAGCDGQHEPGARGHWAQELAVNAGCDDDYCNQLRGTYCDCGYYKKESTMNCDNSYYKFNSTPETADYWREGYQKLSERTTHKINELHATIANLENGLTAIHEKHKRVLISQGQIAESWRNAFMERGDKATATEIEMQNRITELEAGYNDVMAHTLKLGDKYNDAQEQLDNERNVSEYLSNRVTELETTIKVLAGLLG